tara:strand:+ start:199 stop:411 length:213 start_codon:yes stop_codon:yes gene_type:complete
MYQFFKKRGLEKFLRNMTKYVSIKTVNTLIMKVENENTKEVSLMRLKDVARITGMGQSTIRQMVTQKRFP